MMREKMYEWHAYDGPSQGIRDWARGHRVRVVRSVGKDDHEVIGWERDDGDLCIEDNAGVTPRESPEFPWVWAELFR